LTLQHYQTKRRHFRRSKNERKPIGRHNCLHLKISSFCKISKNGRRRYLAEKLGGTTEVQLTERIVSTSSETYIAFSFSFPNAGVRMLILLVCIDPGFKENRSAWSRYFFRPRVLHGIVSGSLETTFSGIPTALPIFCSPTAMWKLGDREVLLRELRVLARPLSKDQLMRSSSQGELNMTAAAADKGIVQCVSHEMTAEVMLGQWWWWRAAVTDNVPSSLRSLQMRAAASKRSLKLENQANTLFIKCVSPFVK